jgi:tetratricopeptide (TPR) repeat protein
MTFGHLGKPRPPTLRPPKTSRSEDCRELLFPSACVSEESFEIKMPLEKSGQQLVRSAHGYIELGMFEEANAELEEIDSFCRHLPEVLLARLAIYHGLKKWELLAVVAKKLVEWNPKEPGFFVELAYATRRAESIHAAHAILTRAAGLHPADATIEFNLACYEAQMGSLDRAKAHLKRATEIDARFRLMALDDPDLEPIWASLSRD